ncbi:LWR-salt protein [Natronomonas marina]|jgi:hypothetical protein|uniref:LWR-salt protein n=1 Tax=Natronomonas marina TaxID=2961939 RepID=UPI0020C9EB61|nr:LWR-salt protein [Natronomonas marina]
MATGEAEYVFSVRVDLSPDDPDLRLDPATVETTLFRRAADPGEDGWLFFRDNLWRGEVNDPDYLRQSAAAALDADVVSIEFRELRTEAAYFEALKAEIADDLALFRAEDAAEVVKKYLGSRVHVVDR